MSPSLMDLLIGRRVSNREAEGRKLGVWQAIPAMGLDSLSSAAYGPEAALAVLTIAGAAGLAVITPITIAILVLLIILGSSYWQTVEAYPTSAGSYVVAKENLGTRPSLLAAAALMLDFTLNVAVGISAGVAAITSAIPALHPWTLPLCLAVLAAITLVNLRGTREAGAAWAVPSYGYILALGCVLVWGVVKLAGSGGHPRAVVPPPPMPQAAGGVSAWLVLRAFASGCSAMTGVEAVSNGVNAFRNPRTRRARGTLGIIVLTLSCMLLGIAYLSQGYAVTTMDQTSPGYQTVISQLTGAVFGHNWFYYVTLFSVLWVLCLSANTSFVGFPRLCHLVAHDGFLPRAFAVPGRRLVYSVGILFLAGGAGCLLVAFGGITNRLIPLFAVGAFLSFTLSQAGMAAHWRRTLHSKRPAQRSVATQICRLKLLINVTGAVATGVALAIIFIAKFAGGAWLTLIVIPATLLLLQSVRGYYDKIDTELCADAEQELDLCDRGEPAVLVPVGGWNQMTRKAVAYALRLSDDVTALHVTTLEGNTPEADAQKLQQDWAKFVEKPARRAGIEPPKLRLVRSQYRSVVAPLLREIEAERRHFPGRPVFVVLPQVVEGHWWERLLQTHREQHLRSRLNRYGGPDVAVIGVPWQLVPSGPREGLAEEEPFEAR